MPTMWRLSPCSAFSAATAGASRLHDGHHGAQNHSTTSLPAVAAKSNCCPSSCAPCSSRISARVSTGAFIGAALVEAALVEAALAGVALVGPAISAVCGVGVVSDCCVTVPLSPHPLTTQMSTAADATAARQLSTATVRAYPWPQAGGCGLHSPQ